MANVTTFSPAWANSAVAGTTQTVAAGIGTGPALVTVVNPGAVNLTVSAQGGGAEADHFHVPAGVTRSFRLMGHINYVNGGASLVLSNDAAVGGAGAFTATVTVDKA